MWKEVKSTTRTFQFGDEPEVIHITKTGHNNLYVVTYDDAYQYFTGRTELCTKEDLKQKFSIDIDKVDMKDNDQLKKLRSLEYIVETTPNDQDLGNRVRKLVNVLSI